MTTIYRVTAAFHTLFCLIPNNPDIHIPKPFFANKEKVLEQVPSLADKEQREDKNQK